MTCIDFFKACALTSAAAPKLEIIEARTQPEGEDEKIGISALEIRTAKNQRCISYISASKKGKETLKSRAKAEELLEGKLDLSQKGIRIERCLLEKEQKDLDGKEYLVLICSFSSGASPSFRSLDEEECSSFGKALGFLHSSRETFDDFISFSASSIRFEMEAWIKRLREADKMDSKILDVWDELEKMDALWDFSPSLIHGGWQKGQINFMESGGCCLSKWEEAQISDPARDLAWMFSQEIPQRQIDAFMEGYAMAATEPVDSFILPRAKLWMQIKIGAELLKAQRRSEKEKILFLTRKLLRLSLDLRSITPQEPQGVLPGAAVDAFPPAQKGIKDLEKEQSVLSSEQISSASRADSQEKPAERELASPPGQEGGKKENRSPTLQSAMWRVAVQAALAKREGRNLIAEVEAAKKQKEAEEINERETMEFSAASFALGKDPSMGADVHVKSAGSAKEKGQGNAVSQASDRPLPAPPVTGQTQTTVIEKIDRNANE